MLEVHGSHGWYSIRIRGTNANVLTAIPLKTKQDAQRLAEEIQSWADWSAPLEELAVDADLSARVASKRMEVIKDYRRVSKDLRPANTYPIRTAP